MKRLDRKIIVVTLMLKVDWVNSFDWHKVVLNLRSAGLSSKTVQEKTGISRHRIRNIADSRPFSILELEANYLLDLHYDHCHDRHNMGLMTL